MQDEAPHERVFSLPELPGRQFARWRPGGAQCIGDFMHTVHSQNACQISPLQIPRCIPSPFMPLAMGLLLRFGSH